MSNIETQQYKLVPFLTTEVLEGDAGTLARCPELDMEFGGPFKRDVAVGSLQKMIETNAKVILKREDVVPQLKELAKRIVQELDRGATIGDLFEEAVR